MKLSLLLYSRDHSIVSITYSPNWMRTASFGAAHVSGKYDLYIDYALGLAVGKTVAFIAEYNISSPY